MFFVLSLSMMPYYGFFMSIVALILITRHVFALLFITRHLFTRHSKLLTRLWCVKQLLYPVGFFFFKATSYQIEEVSYFQMFSTSECCQVLSNALPRGLRWSVFAPLSILWERWLAQLVSLISNSKPRSAPRPWLWLPHAFVLKLPSAVPSWRLSALR